MIISAEHHGILEEFKRANEVEATATRTLREYMQAVTKDLNDPIVKQLYAAAEAAHEKTMQLDSELKKLDLSK